MTVDLDFLESKLLSGGVDSIFAAGVVELFRNRKVFVRDHNNVLHGPRNVSLGLPQGSVLSPYLFNIYTAGLHDLFSAPIKCIQYADDFCIYTVRGSVSECVVDLEYTLRTLEKWLTEHGFTLSPSKSAVVYFTRHRMEDVNHTNLGGYCIPVQKVYKYLGIYLDSKLLWSKHIKYIEARSEKAMNMLKCVVKCTWGADPLIALMFYRCYIRSILDHGCIVYGSSCNSNLKIIDRLQYKALKICLGAFRSSPSPAVLAEAQEPPLELRRVYLSSKYITKLREYDPNKLLNDLHNLIIEDLTGRYWRVRNSPPLVKALVDTRDLEDIYRYTPLTKLPIFNIPYDAAACRNIVVLPSYSENPQVNKNIVSSLTDIERELLIYTDGSKTTSGVGCCFYIANTDEAFTYRLPDHSSIYTAESYAILSALHFLRSSSNNNTTRRVKILTDSKSVLQAVSSFPVKKNKNFIICELIKTLFELKQMDYVITLMWIRGHSGVTGNEIADMKAKDATNMSFITPIRNISDSYPILKKRLRVSWELEYKKFVFSSSNPYSLIHPVLPSTVFHITELSVPRRYSTSITRLRLNHGRFPSHLHKIKIRNSPLCSCDGVSIGDLNHIFFGCRNNQQFTNELLTNLLEIGYQLPLNVTTLLNPQKQSVYDILIKFLSSSKIEL